jgi:hypothetical protein
MTSAEHIAEITEEIAYLTADLAEYVADGDTKSAQDARAMIADYKEALAVELGADPATVNIAGSTPANEGIHSGGAYLA